MIAAMLPSDDRHRAVPHIILQAWRMPGLMCPWQPCHQEWNINRVRTCTHTCMKPFEIEDICIIQIAGRAATCAVKASLDQYTGPAPHTRTPAHWLSPFANSTRGLCLVCQGTAHTLDTPSSSLITQNTYSLPRPQSLEVKETSCLCLCYGEGAMHEGEPRAPSRVSVSGMRRCTRACQPGPQT